MLDFAAALNPRLRDAEQTSLQTYINNSNGGITSEFELYTSLLPPFAQRMLRSMRELQILTKLEKLPFHWRSFYTEILLGGQRRFTSKEVQMLLNRFKADVGVDNTTMLAFWMSRAFDKSYYLSTNWRPCLYSNYFDKLLMKQEMAVANYEYVTVPVVEEVVDMGISDAEDAKKYILAESMRDKRRRSVRALTKNIVAKAAIDKELEELDEDSLATMLNELELEEEELEDIELQDFVTAKKIGSGVELSDSSSDFDSDASSDLSDASDAVAPEYSTMPLDMLMLHSLWDYTEGKLPSEPFMMPNDGNISNVSMAMDSIDQQFVRKVAQSVPADHEIVKMAFM